MSQALAGASSQAPRLAMPPRPAKPLPPLTLLKTAATNTLGIFDEQIFDELIVVRRFGIADLAFVSDPDGIKRVLVDEFENYPRAAIIRRLYEAEVGTGTLASIGETWWRHRRIAGPTLDRRALAPEIPKLIESAEALAESMSARYAGTQTDVEIRVAEIWLLLLNQMVTGGDPRAIPILCWLGKVPRRPRILDLAPMPRWLRERVSSARQSDERVQLREELLGMIRERLAEGYTGPNDFLWRMAHGTDRQTGLPLPELEMRDEASSQLAAGEASVRALTWIWYLLALHPEVESRLHAELDAVLGDGPLLPEHMRQLVYTRQVLDEVIRLYPPIPLIVRQARRADVIAGRNIPRGAYVIAAPWVVHHHRRLWSDPERFDPDRFSAERSHERSRYAYIPFSIGPGNCSGATFASTQMMIVVAALARRFRFRLASDAPITPVSGISLRPDGGLPMTVERR